MVVTGSNPNKRPARGSRQGQRRGSKRPATGKNRRKRTHRRKRAAGTAFRKTVKDLIRKTVGCDSDTGVYSRNYTSDSRIYHNDGNLDVCLFGGVRNGDVVAPYTAYALSFTPHSINKIYDAVSVLYNAKARSMDYTSSGNFSAQGFKFELLYANYELEIYNGTLASFELEIHEYTNKANSTTALQDNIASAIGMHKWPSGGTLTWSQYSAALPNHYQTEIGFPLARVTALAKKYTHRLVKSIILGPGQTTMYKSSRKASCVDITKFFTDGTTNVATYCKGDKQLMIRLRPKLHIGYSGAGTVSIGSQGYSTTGTNENAGYGIVFKTNEFYKVLQPGETEDANTGDQLAHFVDIPVNDSNRLINYNPKHVLESTQFKV